MTDWVSSSVRAPGGCQPEKLVETVDRGGAHVAERLHCFLGVVDRSRLSVARDALRAGPYEERDAELVGGVTEKGGGPVLLRRAQEDQSIARAEDELQVTEHAGVGVALDQLRSAPSLAHLRIWSILLCESGACPSGIRLPEPPTEVCVP